RGHLSAGPSELHQHVPPPRQPSSSAIPARQCPSRSRRRRYSAPALCPARYELRDTPSPCPSLPFATWLHLEETPLPPSPAISTPPYHQSAPNLPSREFLPLPGCRSCQIRNGSLPRP